MTPFRLSLSKALTLVISIGLGLLNPNALTAQTITFVTTNGEVQHMDLSDVESMVFRNNHAVVNTGACTHQHFNTSHHPTIALDSLAASLQEQNHASLQLEIFPNPVAETLSLSWDEPASMHANVFNMQGALMASYAVSGGRAELNVSSLPRGMYVLVLGHQTTPFLKQ